MATDLAYARTTPTKWGPMLVPRGDVYVGWSLIAYGEFSPDERRFLVRMTEPGMTVLDIGANVGALTLPLAERVGITGHVIALEPQPELATLLRENVIACNRASVVSVIQKAIGKAPGTMHLPALDYGALNNFGGIRLGHEGRPVEVVTVDALGLTECHLIKADVEGMELDVLLGAAETIARHRPILYLEADQEPKVPRLKQHLSKLGYRWREHRPPLYAEDNHRGLPCPLPHLIDVVSVNLVCIPRERPKADWEREL